MYTTEYFIETRDDGVEATVYENSLSPSDVNQLVDEPAVDVRPMTPYDHKVLFEALNEVYDLQNQAMQEENKLNRRGGEMQPPS